MTSLLQRKRNMIQHFFPHVPFFTTPWSRHHLLSSIHPQRPGIDPSNRHWPRSSHSICASITSNIQASSHPIDPLLPIRPVGQAADQPFPRLPRATIHPSIHPAIQPSNCPSPPSIYPTMHSSYHPPIPILNSPIHPTVHAAIHPPIHPSIKAVTPTFQ